MIHQVLRLSTNSISRCATRSFALSFKGENIEKNILEKIKSKDNEIRKNYESIDPPMNPDEYDAAR